MNTLIKPSLATIYTVDICSAAMAALYTAIERPAPSVVTIFVTIAPIVAVGTWLQRYLRQSGPLPFDFGWFFMLGWPVLIWFYSRRIQPEKRYRFIGAMYLFALAPKIVAIALSIAFMISGRRPLPGV